MGFRQWTTRELIEQLQRCGDLDAPAVIDVPSEGVLVYPQAVETDELTSGEVTLITATPKPLV